MAGGRARPNLRTRQRRGEAHGHSARVAGAARWAVFKTIQARQSQDCKGAWPLDTADAACTSRRGDRWGHAVRSGTSRHFRFAAEFGRYWGIADIDQAAPIKLDL